MKKSLSMFALAGLASAAMGQTFTNAGPFSSDGADNAGANGVWSFLYAGAGGLGTWTISGTANDGGVGSYLNELRVRLTGVGTTGMMNPGATWAGGQAIGPSGVGGLVTMNAGDTVSFRFWETYDDPGIDATWTNLTATFAPYIAPPPPASIFLGNFAAPASITMSSNGTAGADSVLALFDSNGFVLGTDDDSGTGAFSQLVQSLGNGTYYIASVEYGPAGATGGAGPGFAMTGGNAAIAAINMTVTDGSTTLVSPGETLANGGVLWYSFTIPTPGTGALMAVGLIASARRRR